MKICNDIPQLEIYYVDERSGVEHSIGRWFRTISETFSEEKVLSIGSDLELWNAIVTRDVTKGGRADRDPGKAIYSSSKKLLVKELQKKKVAVSNAEKGHRLWSELGTLQFPKRRCRFQIQD